ncbi:MAG TPA: protein kinase, partial [Bryobacteraceae bacterium]|nr:protein kinase [Bryobacteraceae bacterium]
MIGRLLGHYRIVGKLGSGGMGDIYRAEDTRLKRDVAVKVLPETVVDDPQQMVRLEREARTLAAMNHPNIATIYGIEDADGVRALVLELVPGQNLSERLRRGPLPLDEALSICRQIAAGLEAAHERGVIHRDIKPANVMITPDGQAKVLDFGLAKSVLARTTDSQTLPMGDELSKPGTMSGTVSYMSPEQARGIRCDEQTDIWAFGCVLYEALTGHRLFAADTLADTLLKITGDDADLNGLPSSTPRRIRLLIERCLRRDPKRRLRHIGDARLELEEKDATELPAPASVPVLPKRKKAFWTGVLATASLAGIAGWFLHDRLALPIARSQTQVHRLTDFVGLEESPAISPDGKSVVFVAEVGSKRQIWLRLLAGGTPLAITKDDVDHYGPRWA